MEPLEQFQDEVHRVDAEINRLENKLEGEQRQYFRKKLEQLLKWEEQLCEREKQQGGGPSDQRAATAPGCR